MTVINTNVASLRASSSLDRNQISLSTSMNRLSTGLRINGASDDAAGMAISTKMTAQIRGLNQAVRNANDGISMLQTAEGDMANVSNALQRMRELAVQAANDTNASSDRTSIQTEFDSMKDEINRIAGNSLFNGTQLSSTTSAAASFSIQVGAGASANDSITVTIDQFDAGANGLNMGSPSLASGTDAQTAITTLTTAIDTLNSARAALGSYQNRLTAAAEALQTTSTNLSASRSRITDTDYAAETTNLARSQIIQQASTAMLAQANQQPQGVLALLK